MIRYPDFDMEQAQALSYVMSCPLAQKAFIAPPFPNFVNIIRQLVEDIDRLADNCHMPEFTNHALLHICSIIQRASNWAVADGWIDNISSMESGYLLIALMIHDLGMLSQDANDLPSTKRIASRKGMSDLSVWVRNTHVLRLPNLVKRLLVEYRKTTPDLDKHLDIMIHIAASHSMWPWESGFSLDEKLAADVEMDVQRLRGLNAVVAVSDLLDEDSNRCDTTTLIRHKHGSNLNIAHWIRHALTAQVKDVRDRKVQVEFRELPALPADFEIVYRVLKNHYRLIRLYQEDLTTIGARIEEVEFEETKVTDAISADMGIWMELPDFKYCLVPRLLSTFEAEAMNTVNSDSEIARQLEEIGIERVDLMPYRDFLLPKIPYTDEERTLLYMKRGRCKDEPSK